MSIGAPWATGLHQVDNPVFDADGNLFVTYSGSRGQEAPVSIFRVTPRGTREPFASGIVNATSMAFGPDGQLYVSSRFEGAVYRVDERRHARAGGVRPRRGVRPGVRRDGCDVRRRSVAARSSACATARAAPFATLPPSVAAFHLAMSPAGELFVTAPTLGSYDHVYRIDRDGQVGRCRRRSAGRRGWRSRPTASLHVVDALAGGERRVPVSPISTAPPELVVSGARSSAWRSARRASCVVASNDTAYRFDVKTMTADVCSSDDASRCHVAAVRAQADRRPAADDGAHSLKRVLGAGDLVMLAIGAVIGAGIFGAIGTAAAGQVGPDGEVIRYGAGPALVFSFVLLGGACALAALCYAELAAMIPQAGSAYAYCVRDARRAGRVDHRLGPDPRVRGRQRRGRDLVGRLLQHAAARRRHRRCRRG